MESNCENYIYYLFVKDIFPIIISIIALIWSLINSRKVALNERNNIQLQSRLDTINYTRHWRREKIYNITDELYELASAYWLVTSDELQGKKLELAIKIRLDDLEINSTALGIDIIEEITNLRRHITGGEFENSSRKPISPSHEKFLLIRQSTQIIKEKLS